MNRFAAVALAMGPVMAFWAMITASASIRLSRSDLAATAHRGIVAAAGCAVVATGGLVAALVRPDFTVRFVAENTSWLVPVRYVAAALLGAPGGALLAWSAFAGIAAIVTAPSASAGRARAWSTAVTAGALGVSLSVVSFAANPFAVVTGAIGDGAGLSPDLQRGAAVIHSVLLLAGCAAALPAFARTVAAVATSSLDDSWDRAVRVWNATAWCALFGAVIAGARWSALNPMRGPWLTDSATSLWLLPVAAGAWLIHLDGARSTGERVALRVLLVSVVFVTATAAIAVLSGSFVHGVVPRAVGSAGRWFAMVPFGALAVMTLVSRAGGGAAAGRSAIADRAPGAMSAWIAHAGFVLVVAAAIGSVFTRSHDAALEDTAILSATDPFGHQWSFTSQGVSTLRRENFGSLTVSVLPSRDDVRFAMLSAEARTYDAGNEEPAAASVPTAFTTGTIAGPFLETRLVITEPDARPVRLRVSFVPLGTWLVPGTLMVALGTLLPMIARRRSVA